MPAFPYFYRGYGQLAWQLVKYTRDKYLISKETTSASMWFPCWQWRMLLPCYPECAEYLRVVSGLGCCSWTQWALGTQRRLETAAWPPEPEPGASHIPSRPGPTLPTHPLALTTCQPCSSRMCLTIWHRCTQFHNIRRRPRLHRLPSMSKLSCSDRKSGNKRCRCHALKHPAGVWCGEY